MSAWSSVHTRAADTIRILSAEAIEKAKSGHPGMPLGAADIAFVLWHKYLRHNPQNPQWFCRDRFVLSAGHGSMLLYSLLYLYGYGLQEDDLKNFRQWQSLTPGHPEFKHTTGVEITTGPLGSGFASAVGMAIAEKHLRATTQLEKSDIPENRIFILNGDGCMMEGVTQEAASLAGHLKLNNIIAIYDSNAITIEGDTNLAFSENVARRFDANGWRVITIENGNDLNQCDAALATAMEKDERPTLIIAQTKIGFQAPTKEGKASSHGEPLGEQELLGLRKNLNFPQERSFEVESDIKQLFVDRRNELIANAAQIDAQFQSWLNQNPESAQIISNALHPIIPENFYQQLIEAILPSTNKPVATRQSSGEILQVIAKLMPSLIGGSADLAPSNKTAIKGVEDFSSQNRKGRNIHFGVREFAMALIGNGIAIHGSAIPFTSTFFVFSDYMKPAIRLAALQQIQQIFIFTHDSFYVGEDGPTHQPIEHLTMLRSIPNLCVIRPADAIETAAAWNCAIRNSNPTALILTRQNLETITKPSDLDQKVAKGAYILEDDSNFSMILIATGSELSVAKSAAEVLRQKGHKVRIVSMPSWDLFAKQSTEYQESILPTACTQRISIEAGSTFGWSRWTGLQGINIGIDHFGASAPAAVLSEKFGFTGNAVAEKIISTYFE